MGIPKGHGHRPVPQDLLDLLQGASPHDHVAGEGVPEIMELEILDPYPPAGCPEGCLDAVYPPLGTGATLRRSLTGFSPFNLSSPFQ
jgi:hypothetical protein